MRTSGWPKSGDHFCTCRGPQWQKVGVGGGGVGGGEGSEIGGGEIRERGGIGEEWVGGNRANGGDRDGGWHLSEGERIGTGWGNFCREGGIGTGRMRFGER